MRPIGDWSMSITLSICSSPAMASCAPGSLVRSVDLACASARYRMSLTSVDLPLPETPVTTVSRPSGNSTSMFFQIVLARAA